MISVSEALHLIDQHSYLLPTEVRACTDAVGYTLARDLFSDVDVPNFDQSAMDGYALQFSGTDTGSTIEVSGVIAAGDTSKASLTPGTCMRIFTGAPIPEGADTVVIQERVTRVGEYITIHDTQLQRGANVRSRASQIQAGAKALERGTLLRPATLGFCSSIGVQHLVVHRKPNVSVITTGDELVKAGDELRFGQVYESNSASLTAVLWQMGINPRVWSCRDNEREIADALRSAAAESDVVLLCGGVSVGDLDLVPKAMMRVGANIVFHGVRQRPGKPLCFATLNNTLLFGLPGNPSSVLVCAYVYVQRCLQLLSGRRTDDEEQIMMPLASEVKKTSELTFFLKGKVRSNRAVPLDAQQSYRLDSFAHADCLIVLEENRPEYTSGDNVRVIPLPG